VDSHLTSPQVISSHVPSHEICMNQSAKFQLPNSSRNGLALLDTHTKTFIFMYRLCDITNVYTLTGIRLPTSTVFPPPPHQDVHLHLTPRITMRGALRLFATRLRGAAHTQRSKFTLGHKLQDKGKSDLRKKK